MIDGYQTLFGEIPSQGSFDLLVVPVGVGSLAAAAARFAARAGLAVVGVEPESAACLGASLAGGEAHRGRYSGNQHGRARLRRGLGGRRSLPLEHGIRNTLTVSDAEAETAVQELARADLAIGHSGAAALAGLRALATETTCAPLREAVGLGPPTRVLAIATEGRTDLVSLSSPSCVPSRSRGRIALANEQPAGGHRVVVVEGGFGGLQAVHGLLRADVDITLIDRRNFHLFQPLTYQVATGAAPGRWPLRCARSSRATTTSACSWARSPGSTWSGGWCMPSPRCPRATRWTFRTTP